MAADAVPEASGGPGWLRAALGTAESSKAKRLARAVTVGAAAWEIGRKIHGKGKDRLTYTVSLPGTDETYDTVHEWLVANIPPKARRSLVARSTRPGWSRHGAADEVSPDGRREERPPEHLRLAYDGSRSQPVRIEGHRVVVSVEREQLSGITLSAADAGWYKPIEKIIFTCYGENARDAVVRFLASQVAPGDAAPKPRFYIARRWGDWQRLSDLPSRPLDTVILREGQKERLVADLRKFLDSETLYGEVGLPWHRGYILHGPPGTGKTSTAKALAEHFGLDVRYIPLSDLDADTNLLALLGSVDSRSVLVLEDVDVVHAAKSRDDAESKGISLSGLLNALDGLTTPHGLVTVMTTNDIEALDPALVRAGRADQTEELGYLDQDQFDRLCTRIVGVASGEPLDRVDATHAEAIEVVKRHLGEREDALLALKQWARA